MPNTASDRLDARSGDCYPENLRGEIDTLNSGFCKSGFAATEAAYEEAVKQSFETLDFFKKRLACSPYRAAH